jgi:predicted O-methyltransferase YrrM
MKQTSSVSVRTILKAAVKRLPIIYGILSERDRMRSELAAFRTSEPFVPPGHFYSPIPSLDEIRKDESRIFGSVPRNIAGVDLHEDEQLRLLETLAAFYEEMPFERHKREGLRYYFENPSYGYSDAILLYGMMRFLKPARVVEVGSGFSSCVMLDTNERFFGRSVALTFIEPHPERLLSLVTDADTRGVTLVRSRLQDVDLGAFDALQANDILFIDSTHVGKIGSDVNRLFFDILPRLSPGVHVHFHDVFFPFEYPRVWAYEGRAWNEAYLLRAFLQYNSAFRVVLMNTFMARFHEPFFRERMPLCLVNTGGSLWIRKERL